MNHERRFILMTVCLAASVIFLNSSALAELIPGHIYAINWDLPNQELIRINPETGEEKVITKLSEKFHWGLTISPDGTFWTIVGDEDARNHEQFLATINPKTGSEQIIGPLPATMIGVETDNDGNLYALGKGTGKIWLLNPQTGSGKVIGTAGPKGVTRGISFSSQGVLSTYDGVRLYRFDFATKSYTTSGTTGSYRYVWEGLAISQDDRIYILNSEDSSNPAALYEYDSSKNTTTQVRVTRASDIQGADFYYGPSSASQGGKKMTVPAEVCDSQNMEILCQKYCK